MNLFNRSSREHGAEGFVEPPEAHVCAGCEVDLTDDERFKLAGVCSACGRREALSARQWIDLLFDRASFDEQFAGIESPDPLHFEDSRPYPERLEEARRRSGERGAVMTGTARIGGLDVVAMTTRYELP